MNDSTIGTLRMRGPGARNSLTDVAGLAVGQAQDARLKSGVSVVLCDQPAIAAVHVMGGAPGTRETDLLEPHNTVERVDAVVRVDRPSVSTPLPARRPGCASRVAASSWGRIAFPSCRRPFCSIS
jgi:hypothetical protein